VNKTILKIQNEDKGYFPKPEKSNNVKKSLPHIAFWAVDLEMGLKTLNETGLRSLVKNYLNDKVIPVGRERWD